MHRSCSRVEGTGVNKHKRSLPGSNHAELPKSDIIAYCQPNFAILGQIHNCDLVSGRQNLAFHKSDLSRYVNVEEMGFAMTRDQLARRGENERCIVVFLCLWYEFGNASADEICLGLCRYGRECMP